MSRTHTLERIWQHRVARNTGALLIVQLVNCVVPFLLLVYLTRTLGTDTYGVLAFSVGIIQTALVVLDLGFTLSATEKISLRREQKSYVSRLIGAIFCIKGVLFVLVSCAVVAYAFTTRKYDDHLALFLLSLLPMLGQCFQPIWFFFAIERMRYITLLVVFSKIVSVFLVFVFVADESDYLWVPLADGIAQTMAAIIAIFLIYKLGYYISFPRFRETKYAFRMTSGFFLSRLSVQAYLNSGVLLLGLIATPATVAVYSLATQLYRAIQSIFYPIVQAIYPYMAREKNFALLGKLTIGSCIVAVVGAAVGYIVTPLLIPLVFGPGWDAAVPVFKVFLLAITIHILTVMSGYPLTAALGCTEVANRSVVYGSIVYIVCALALFAVRETSAVAFAWLMIVAESYVLLYRVLVLWPQVRRLQILKNLSKEI